MSAKSFCFTLKWLLVGNVVMMSAFVVFLVIVTPNATYEMNDVPQFVERVFSFEVANGKAYLTSYLKAVKGGMALAGRMLFMSIQVCLLSMVGSIIVYGLLKKASPSGEGLGDKGESVGEKR